jgi:hypothetical protein
MHPFDGIGKIKNQAIHENSLTGQSLGREMTLLDGWTH